MKQTSTLGLLQTFKLVKHVSGQIEAEEVISYSPELFTGC